RQPVEPVSAPAETEPVAVTPPASSTTETNPYGVSVANAISPLATCTPASEAGFSSETSMQPAAPGEVDAMGAKPATPGEDLAAKPAVPAVPSDHADTATKSAAQPYDVGKPAGAGSSMNYSAGGPSVNRGGGPTGPLPVCGWPAGAKG